MSITPSSNGLAYASNDEFIYNDQDVLNAHCEGNVLYLPWEWNVVHDCGGRVGNLFVQAPNDIYDAYMKSRSNPQIIHYAGFQKPWTDPDCDFASIYWKYARETPFYERLLKRVVKANESQISEGSFLPKHERAVGEDNPIRQVHRPIDADWFEAPRCVEGHRARSTRQAVRQSG